MRFKKLIQACLAAAVLGVSATAVHAETLRLRFHTFYGTEMDHAAKTMQETVKEESDGKIRIQYFRGGELVESPQFVDAVARGTIDIAHGVGSYWPGQVVIGNIEAGIPGAWTSVEEAEAAFEKINPLLEEAYAEKGVVLIGRGLGSDYELLTKEPVNTLDDLKSMKIRATGQMARVLESFDVPTVFLPAEELYVGLSTGVIDGVLYGGPLEYEQLKLNEVAKHYTTLNMLKPGWTENIIVNKDTWEKLNPEQQELVRKATQQYAQDIHDWLEAGNNELKEVDGMFVFNELAAEDSALMVEAAQVIWDEEAKKSPRNAEAIELIRANAAEFGR